MDTITHGIVGALTGKAFFAGRDVPAGSLSGMFTAAQSSTTARAAILACAYGSIFPDIDVFAGPLAGNPLATMTWHRNITHSLLMLPLWAVFLAVVTVLLARWLRWKLPPFWKLAVIYGVGLATHVFLDLVTSFGTMIWSPLNYSRPAWDIVFIIDLLVTAIALTPQLAAWCYREPGKFTLRGGAVWAGLTVGAFGGYALANRVGFGFPIWVVGILSAIFAFVVFSPAVRGAGFRWSRANWCRAGLALLCAYVAVATVMHRNALADVNEFAATRHLPTGNRAALPLPPTLTHWSGLISTPEGVLRTMFHEPGGVVEDIRLYADDQADPHVAEARKLRDVQIFLWFARFPLWQVRQEDGKTIVNISDVRFFREGNPATNPDGRPPLRIPIIRPNPTGRIFEIVFDASGQVISSGPKIP